MTATEAMEIWNEISEIEFMDLEEKEGCFKFFGVTKEGKAKIESIHKETLEFIAREILPYMEK